MRHAWKTYTTKGKFIMLISDGWKYRYKISMPFQTWCHGLPDGTIVQVRSYYEDVPDNVGPVESFWWGYDTEFGVVSEGVIASYRVLSKTKEG